MTVLKEIALNSLLARVSNYQSMHFGTERLEPLNSKDLRISTRRGQINPELVIIGVPLDQFGVVHERIGSFSQGKDRRTIITNGTGTGVTLIGREVHWVQYGVLEIYLKATDRLHRR